MNRLLNAMAAGFAWGLLSVGVYWLIVSMFNLR